MAATLSEILPGLGIGAFYLSVFDKKEPFGQEARLLLAYDATAGGVRVVDEPFAARVLVPPAYLDGTEARAHAILPLHFAGERLGIVAMSYAATPPYAFETLNELLGAAVHRLAAAQA